MYNLGRSNGLIFGILLIAMVWGSTLGAHADNSVMLFDFREGTHGWTGNHHITGLEATNEGIAFESTGNDPWIEGPPVINMPRGDRVRITIRMKSSDGDSSGEIFYGPSFSAERQGRFFIQSDGDWHEYSILLPEQVPGSRLRIDPAADTGKFVVAWIKADLVQPLISPEFSPAKPVVFDKEIDIVSGDLRYQHNGADWDGYALWVADEQMAMGHTDAEIGVMLDGGPQMITLKDADIQVEKTADVLNIEAKFTDDDGGQWILQRSISADKTGTIRVHTSVSVNQDREVYHLPWLSLFPGLNTYGEVKNQAILPGIDYLENEPSSSMASFNAAQADRRIVEDFKLTLPMMALQVKDRYIGVLWNREAMPATIFDSPDRVFHSKAHLMGLWYPAVGDLRLENELSVFGTFPIQQGVPLEFELFFLGGMGNSIVPAAQHYIALRDTPDLPELEGGFQQAIRLLAGGWLDSAGHDDGLWRHAVWPGFGLTPAADAPAFMMWLAHYTEDDALAERLYAAAERGLERLDPYDNYQTSVGHCSRPTPTLLFGNIANNIQRMMSGARMNLSAFDENGIRRYHQPDPSKPDYGRTHFEDHANGFNAQALEPILLAATFSGDETLIREALRLLDLQTHHYADTVPRGAQTWEMPLHTPDIVGSGRLIRTYVMGYLLTGNEDYLEQARYWAWTGIPLIYLDHPVEGPVGTYATIAVLGATNWVAPNWIGLPVQWCGLVYRSALHDLARIDPVEGAFWDHIAKGITLSGLQQSFSLDDEERQGLLPDFFYLREQISDGPAISPGTVQAHMAEAYGKTAYYSVERINDDNVLVHVPGDIQNITLTEGKAAMDIQIWTEEPYWVRITRVNQDVDVQWNGNDPVEVVYDATYNALNVRLQGNGNLTINQL